MKHKVAMVIIIVLVDGQTTHVTMRMLHFVVSSPSLSLVVHEMYIFFLSVIPEATKQHYIIKKNENFLFIVKLPPFFFVVLLLLFLFLLPLFGSCQTVFSLAASFFFDK